MVARLGDAGGAIGEVAGVVLVGIEQGPQRDAAIDDIFAVITGIVPAAADIEPVGAAGPDIATLVGAGEAGRDFGGVARRPRPSGADIARLDRHAGALVVEEGKRIGSEIAAGMRADGEGMALHRADPQAIALAGGGEAGEVDAVDGLTRRGVGTEHGGAAAQDHPALRVDQLPVERAMRRTAEHRALGAGGLEAGLVEPDRGDRIGLCSRGKRGDQRQWEETLHSPLRA